MNRYCVFLFFETSDHVLWSWRRFIYFWTYFPGVCLTSEKFSAFRSLEFALDRTKRVKNQRKHKITSHDTKQKSNMADFY